MLKIFKISTLVIASLLVGCAATVQHSTINDQRLQVSAESSKKIVLTVKGSEIASQSADWELLRAEWRTGMSFAARNAALNYTYSETEPAPGKEAGTLIVVKVNDYRYISPGARYGFGVMTGNAFIDSDVEFIDLQTGRAIGTKKYGASSSAWEGIFSAMTDKQIQAICTEIVKEVIRK